MPGIRLGDTGDGFHAEVLRPLIDSNTQIEEECMFLKIRGFVARTFRLHFRRCGPLSLPQTVPFHD